MSAISFKEVPFIVELRVEEVVPWGLLAGCVGVRGRGTSFTGDTCVRACVRARVYLCIYDVCIANMRHSYDE